MGLLSQLNRVVYRRATEDFLGMKLKQLITLEILARNEGCLQQELGRDADGRRQQLRAAAQRPRRPRLRRTPARPARPAPPHRRDHARRAEGAGQVRGETRGARGRGAGQPRPAPTASGSATCWPARWRARTPRSTSPASTNSMKVEGTDSRSSSSPTYPRAVEFYGGTPASATCVDYEENPRRRVRDRQPARLDVLDAAAVRRGLVLAERAARSRCGVEDVEAARAELERRQGSARVLRRDAWTRASACRAAVQGNR